MGGNAEWQNSSVLLAMEQLRVNLLATMPRLDSSRAFLTGLSHGGDAVWAWAAFYSPAGAWKAIVPTASKWPTYAWIGDFNVSASQTDIDADVLHKLRGIRTLIAHCANDMSAPPYLSAEGQPTCVEVHHHETSEYNHMYHGQTDFQVCGIGTDAIVEQVTRDGANRSEVRYERYDHCNASGRHNDHDPVRDDSDPNTWYRAEHDAWTPLYASDWFTSWLLQ
jgi:predicted peptidase